MAEEKTPVDMEQLAQMIEQGFAVMIGSLNSLEERMGALEGRMGALEERMNSLESRVGGVEGRLSKIETEIRNLRTDLNKQVYKGRAESHVAGAGALAAAHG